MLFNLKSSPFSQIRLISNGLKRFQSTSVTKSGETSSFGESESQNKDSEDNDFIVNIPEAEEAIEKEEKFKIYVEKMRDVSRFSKRTALEKYRGARPTFSDPEARYLKDPKYFRKHYASLGKASGIEPGIAWPHKQELQEIIKEEKEYDLTLEQKVKILIERKQNQHDEFMKMGKDVDDSLKKMPKQIENFYQRILKKDKADEERLKKKQELLDQAREFYGYEVDMRDTRIQEMVKKLQDDKKAEEKAKKKEEDKKKLQASILQQKFKEGEKILEGKNEKPKN